MKRAQHEAMLERVRRALGRAPDQPDSVPSYPDLPELVQRPPSRAALVDQFEQELREIGGNPHRAESPRQLQEILRSLLKGTPEPNAVLTRNPIISYLSIINTLQEHGTRVTAWQGGGGWPGCRGVPEGLIRGPGGGIGSGLRPGGDGFPRGFDRHGRNAVGLACPAHAHRPLQAFAGRRRNRGYYRLAWDPARRALPRPGPLRGVYYRAQPDG